MNGTYIPLPYSSFYISDPKPRHIHKANIRDRVLHQAIFRVLYPIFDKTFIHDSYSSRVDKGTHAGVARLLDFLRKASANYQKPAFALKCDVSRFFDLIDHRILLELIARRIHDEHCLTLVRQIVESFSTAPGKGLPLGNVTSQLFANIYLNELDQFVKHSLKRHWCLRYCDDFVMVGSDREELHALIEPIRQFLDERFVLTLHPRKIVLRSYQQGVDFLGYVLRPHVTTLRTNTRRRLLRRVTGPNLSSYLGVLSHCRGYKIKKQIFEKLS